MYLPLGYMIVIGAWLSVALAGQSNQLLSPIRSGLVASDDNQHVRERIVLPAIAEFRSRWYDPVLVVSVAPPRAEEAYHVFMLFYDAERGYAMKAVQYQKTRALAASGEFVKVSKEVVFDLVPLAVAQKLCDSAACALAAIRFPASDLQVLDGICIEVALWLGASVRAGVAIGSSEGPRANLMIAMMTALGKAAFQDSGVDVAARWANVIEIAETIMKKFPVAAPADAAGK